MKPTWQTSDGSVKLWLAKHEEVLPSLDPQSIDLCLVDPPYDIVASGGGFDTMVKRIEAELARHPLFTEEKQVQGSFL